MPGTGLPSVEEIRDALMDADFPADKDELIQVAERNGAASETISALRGLPVSDYANKDEVVRSVDTVEATGSTPSEHAAKSRTETRPGVAQHQRTSGER